MNSPGHRANLLDPNSREIGLGYYLRESDRRGYVVQDFGADVVYPPSGAGWRSVYVSAMHSAAPSP